MGAWLPTSRNGNHHDMTNQGDLREQRWRRGVYVAITAARSALWDLERPERKEVQRAIRRGTDVRPELRDVALRTARQMTRLRRFLWFYVLLAALELANGLVLQDGFARWS